MLSFEKNEVEDRAMSGEVIEATNIDGEGGIYVTLAGEKFECRRVDTTYQMMKFAKAQRLSRTYIPIHLKEDHPDRVKAEQIVAHARMASLECFLDIINRLLKPYERERFDAFMEDADLASGELTDAIQALMADVNGAKEDEKGDDPGKAGMHSLPSSAS